MIYLIVFLFNFNKTCFTSHYIIQLNKFVAFNLVLRLPHHSVTNNKEGVDHGLVHAHHYLLLLLLHVFGQWVDVPVDGNDLPLWVDGEARGGVRGGAIDLGQGPVWIVTPQGHSEAVDPSPSHGYKGVGVALAGRVLLGDHQEDQVKAAVVGVHVLIIHIRHERRKGVKVENLGRIQFMEHEDDVLALLGGEAERLVLLHFHHRLYVEIRCKVTRNQNINFRRSAGIEIFHLVS